MTNRTLTITLKENRGGKNQDACCTAKSITKKSPLEMKKFFSGEEMGNKQNNSLCTFIEGNPQTSAKDRTRSLSWFNG